MLMWPIKTSIWVATFGTSTKVFFGGGGKIPNDATRRKLRRNTRPWKDHFKSDLRSDQDHRQKNDLRSDQEDHLF
jgi:hypothetical protein